jgi:hypothetical protein
MRSIMTAGKGSKWSSRIAVMCHEISFVAFWQFLPLDYLPLFLGFIMAESYLRT